MSQSNADAEMSNLGVGEAEKVDWAMEIGSEVKVCVDQKVECCSEFVEEDVEIAADGDKSVEEPEEILNEYAINEIAKYLKFQDLKSLRIVNKLWSAGSTPQFLQNAVISLYAGRTSEETLKAIAEKAMNLKRLKALKIELRHSRSEKEVEIIQDIFAALAPTLQALQFHYRVDRAFFLRGGAPISLPTLTSITLDDCNFELETWRLLYTAAPNITQLIQNGDERTSLSSLLADDGSRNWSIAPNLKSLKVNFLHSQNGGWHSPESFLWNNSKNFLFLIKFPQPWEALDITLSSYTANDFKALFKLLDKNKDSLGKLKLDINDERPFYSPPQNPFPPRPYTLKLPATFPKIKKLELDFTDLCVHNDVSFGDRGLLYSEAFPALTSLSVDIPWSSGTAGGIFRSLFPPQVPRQVFRGLRTFKVVGGRYIPFLQNVEVVQNWAGRIFPQATLEIILN